MRMSMNWPSPLLRLQSDGFDKCRVDGDVLGDECIEFAWRHHHWIETQRSQLVPHLGLLQRLAGLAVKLVDNLARRPCRHKKSEPRWILGVIEPGLLGGRHIGKRGGSFRAVHRKRSELAILDVW